ncbi:unnamed protein product [Camellia sinensis]
MALDLWKSGMGQDMNDPILGDISSTHIYVVLHGQSITASNTIVSAGNYISSNGNTSATLLDSGNLVLRDRTSGELLWQSFDYPSHTLLPGMKLGYSVINRKTWSLISWKSREDPGPGVFSLEFDPQGTPQFFIMKGPQKYRTRKLQLLSWSETTHQWDLFWSQPSQQCGVYAYCGAFSICSQKALPFCQCLPGFEPCSVQNWNVGDMSGGCVRKAPLQCGNDSHANGQSDQFIWIPKVRLLFNPMVLQGRGAFDCDSACLNICSCSAFAYGSDGCSIWSEDLFNLEQLKDDDPDRSDFYLKLSASAFLCEDSRRKRWKWFILALAVSMTLVLLYVEVDKVTKQRAWDLWKSGMGQDMKDPILGDIPSINMLLRCVNIGLLCVQERVADRRTMSSVVSMLTNELVLLPSPKQEKCLGALISAPTN